MVQPLIDRLAREGTLTLTVRARPYAKSTRLAGVLDDGSLKADLHAAPEDGQANEELIRLLSEAFAVPRAQVELLSGHTGRLKNVRITR